MGYNELHRIESEVLGTTYAVGVTEDGEFVYVWTCRRLSADLIPQGALERPTAEHGAMVGTLDEIVAELNECVGSFRYWGDENQAEAAAQVVEECVAALEAVGV